METFYRAVECAEHIGYCDLDQMEQLIRELEEMNGNLFENTEELKEKEINDRQDVADVLKLQGELLCRMDYLQGANLFVQDVHEIGDTYTFE